MSDHTVQTDLTRFDDLLQTIHESAEEAILVINGGSLTTDEVVELRRLLMHAVMRIACNQSARQAVANMPTQGSMEPS